MTKIWIIWWSGLNNPDILKELEEIKIETEYGQPSSDFLSCVVGY